MRSITRFITQRLKLKVNEAKSAVARPQERRFLGFSFTNGPEIRRAIAPKAVVRFKDKIRETTRQAKGISIETTVKRLATYMPIKAVLRPSRDSIKCGIGEHRPLVKTRIILINFSFDVIRSTSVRAGVVQLVNVCYPFQMSPHAHHYDQGRR